MKNLSLFVSAFALCASSASAIDCGTLPSCDSLGYTDTVTQCPNKSVKCPFDTSKGICLHEAAVGEIAYFTKTPGKGWLLCNGQTITKDMYPDLYTFLGQQFCTADHGGTCGNNVGRVPDYRGYFLRVYAQASYGSYVASSFSTNSKTYNSSFTSPQKEGLPNITGQITSDHAGELSVKFDGYSSKTSINTINGAFYSARRFDNAYATGDNGIGYLVDFSAQKSNAIYGAQSGVTPPNYAVYAYIYAGKVVK